MNHSIRKINPSDVPALKKVLDSIDLFPSEMMDDMISDFFNNPTSEDIWFAAVENEKTIGLGYCASEKLTVGTYNLYAIGVRSDLQGKGIGAQMMSYLENELKNKEARVLIVDTSGSEEFKLTRKFYEKLGYTKEAVIRDFWDEGDDKVTFWKKLI